MMASIQSDKTAHQHDYQRGTLSDLNIFTLISVGFRFAPTLRRLIGLSSGQSLFHHAILRMSVIFYRKTIVFALYDFVYLHIIDL
ncbi:hypothetical protein HMPREF3034_01115 [Prevotella sp. DNF00663]|nr:hypothetical protein HMPREF3034_01115 [Prevotella sp. DNF00663]